VLVDDEAKQATVIVPDDQLSLAIGKDGLNARLAARLTGWRVDIRSETEFAEEEAEMGYQEEEVSGRCAAILANGKRCPNASLPGSRYCGLPAHQALEGTETDYLVPPEDEGEDQPAPSDNGDLPVEDLVEAVADEAPVEEAPVASADEVSDDGVAEVEAAQENEEMDAGEAPAVEEDDEPVEDDDEPVEDDDEPSEGDDEPSEGEEPAEGGEEPAEEAEES